MELVALHTGGTAQTRYRSRHPSGAGYGLCADRGSRRHDAHEQRQFGAFKRDRRELAHWVVSLKPDEVVMESTGIYWKSPYAALEAVGIRAKVVNAKVRGAPFTDDKRSRRARINNNPSKPHQGGASL